MKGIGGVGRGRKACEDFLIGDGGLPRLVEFHVAAGLAQQTGKIEGGIFLDVLEGVFGVGEAGGERVAVGDEGRIGGERAGSGESGSLVMKYGELANAGALANQDLLSIQCGL